MSAQPSEQTFWDHLEVLRGCLWRMLVAILAGAVVSFCFKETLFDLVLAPASGDFFVYRWMGAEDFRLHLINTELTEQMMVHLRVAFAMGCLLASPYVIYVLFGFISPALYENERRYSLRLVTAAYVMFLLGVVVNYVIIFPLTVRFLGTYQVSPDIDNMLTIGSFVDTWLMMSIVFGIVFEIPVLSWLLAFFGLLRADWMRRYRRHAIVVILIVAAIVTPTADAFTLFVVALPIWLLYEVSVWVVARAERESN